MAHIRGDARTQLLLLPEAVDDYVGPDNPVRFIDAFVDGIDLGAAGFVRARAKDTGRPGYDPGDLLKLYIYGYLNRVRSSRRLELETRRNIEVIWLLRRLSPDFKTIADFRRDSRAAFRQVFREFVAVCRELSLFGRELVAVDGTRIKAVNSRERNFTQAKLASELRASDERLERYLGQLDEADRGEAAPTAEPAERLQEKIATLRERRARLEAYSSHLVRSCEDQLSLTDPDARAMHSNTRIGVGYNVQIAVDARYKLIAEQQVHAKVSDLGLLTVTATAARDNLGVERIEAVADGGCFKTDDLEAREAAGIVPNVPRPERSTAARKGLFAKTRFRYQPESDSYLCPAGAHLSPLYRYERRGTMTIDYLDRGACRHCALKARCTTGLYRKIVRHEHEAVQERMAERLAARPEPMTLRCTTVEHPFGSIKQ